MSVSTEKVLYETVTTCTNPIREILIDQVKLPVEDTLTTGMQIDIKVVVTAGNMKRILIIGPDGFVLARRRPITDDQLAQLIGTIERMKNINWR